ncbi:hypothetical protein RHSIM_Rhsim02G0155300 [Rhododendron simsii]|uniref:Uncharacterized protein n=1 Tax=Rhododendron simsii TaxID=118357 RepID=A0A834LXM3_RHOSS|nr:hypothetical protein RHSIM_Rhsim02G0155300 [Rhododendron simsii]
MVNCSLVWEFFNNIYSYDENSECLFSWVRGFDIEVNLSILGSLVGLAPLDDSVHASANGAGVVEVTDDEPHRGHNLDPNFVNLRGQLAAIVATGRPLEEIVTHMETRQIAMQAKHRAFYHAANLRHNAAQLHEGEVGEFIRRCYLRFFFCLIVASNVNQGHDIITPQVHIADIRRVLAFNGEGTYLAGRARVAQVLLSYRASYSGFIDWRTHAADNPIVASSSTSHPEQGEERRSRMPPF